MPLRGKMVISPSRASRCSASRIGVRPNAYVAESICSDRISPGLSRKRDDLLLDHPIGLLGERLRRLRRRAFRRLAGGRRRDLPQGCLPAACEAGSTDTFACEPRPKRLGRYVSQLELIYVSVILTEHVQQRHSAADLVHGAAARGRAVRARRQRPFPARASLARAAIGRRAVHPVRLARALAALPGGRTRLAGGRSPGTRPSSAAVPWCWPLRCCCDLFPMLSSTAAAR